MGLLRLLGPRTCMAIPIPTCYLIHSIDVDELYYGQMMSLLAGGFTSQHRSTSTTQFSGPGPGGGRPGAVGPDSIAM
ncbi:hypothetical protein PAXRUDRAFT_830595 [Paxillus rubicundulus Ve08.2h10]|uniref:Uncharacterized protein n=1 Tax=Paxillus rubicundulus Ve08.2h10 TaxID=930991 RepID=A0A0D0E3N4_9AGAM|nr:hypothetical protein PAXRUDRAFT_830595 [Paxillus rubicundulus Ve08.2h10]